MAHAPLRHVPHDHLDDATAQTAGMRRVAAVSAAVGSQALFMGQTHLPPGVTSGPHHHGESETAIYVVAGRPAFVFRDGDDEVRLECQPGDYVYVPPFTPHVEDNGQADEEAVVVLARTTQEAIVVNLDAL